MGVSNTPTSETRERSRSRGPEESPVPIIDIAALSSDDAAARRSVAHEIGRACEQIGFFVVVNHGIPQEVVQSAWSNTLAFFDLPLEEKKKFVSEDESKYPYGNSANDSAFSCVAPLVARFVIRDRCSPGGYSVLGGEQLSRGKEVDGGGKTAAAGDLKVNIWQQSCAASDIAGFRAVVSSLTPCCAGDVPNRSKGFGGWDASTKASIGTGRFRRSMGCSWAQESHAMLWSCWLLFAHPYVGTEADLLRHTTTMPISWLNGSSELLLSRLNCRKTGSSARRTSTSLP